MCMRDVILEECGTPLVSKRRFEVFSIDLGKWLHCASVLITTFVQIYCKKNRRIWIFTCRLGYIFWLAELTFSNYRQNFAGKFCSLQRLCLKTCKSFPPVVSLPPRLLLILVINAVTLQSNKYSVKNFASSFHVTGYGTLFVPQQAKSI